MDDAELLELSRRGDGPSFGVLVERHQAALYNLALRILGDREDALDALQDACVKAWRGVAQQRGGAFRSWMSSIVARTCIDRIRARHPTDSLEDEEGRVIPLPDREPGPEVQALAHDRVRSIERGLKALSAEQRAIVLMRDLNGLSYEEIASGLGVPLGTVRSRLARARARLQMELLRVDPGILEAQA